MDLKGLGNRLLDLWGRSALTRFCSFVVTVGAGLLSVSWTDVAAAIASAVIGAVFPKTNPGQYDWVPQVTGIVLIAIGIIGRLLLYFVFAAWTEKRVAATLVGRLRVLLKGFETPGVRRDSGYFNKEIVDCQKAAKDYLAVAPAIFSGSVMLASIAEPKFDASKDKPYFDSTLADLSTFIEQLRKHYAIE